MDCNKQFKKFNENISLKQTRIKRIEDVVSALEVFATNDKGDEKEDGISDVLVEPIYLQGSFPINTAIRPTESEEYDVDAVLCIERNDSEGKKRDAKTTLQWLARRLKANGNYTEKVDLGDRRIRIDYAGDFHLDIIPVIPILGEESAVELPSKADGWVKTDPKGFMDWFLGRRGQGNKSLSRLTKYLKWWRSNQTPQKMKVASVILTKLIGDHFHDNVLASDAEALVETMESLNIWLSTCPSKPQILHPTIYTDMAERWSQEEFILFKEQFSKATDLARQAYDDEEIDKSIELWKKLFGNEFPSLDGEKDTGKGLYIAPKSSGQRPNREFA